MFSEFTDQYFSLKEINPEYPRYQQGCQLQLCHFQLQHLEQPEVRHYSIECILLVAIYINIQNGQAFEIYVRKDDLEYLNIKFRSGKNKSNHSTKMFSICHRECHCRNQGCGNLVFPYSSPVRISLICYPHAKYGLAGWGTWFTRRLSQ